MAYRWWQRLLAQTSPRDGANERLSRELAEAEREKENLARAIAKRVDLDALLCALDEATKRASSRKRPTLSELLMFESWNPLKK